MHLILCGGLAVLSFSCGVRAESHLEVERVSPHASVVKTDPGDCILSYVQGQRGYLLYRCESRYVVLASLLGSEVVFRHAIDKNKKMLSLFILESDKDKVHSILVDNLISGPSSGPELLTLEVNGVALSSRPITLGVGEKLVDISYNPFERCAVFVIDDEERQRFYAAVVSEDTLKASAKIDLTPAPTGAARVDLGAREHGRLAGPFASYSNLKAMKCVTENDQILGLYYIDFYVSPGEPAKPGVNDFYYLRARAADSPAELSAENRIHSLLGGSKYFWLPSTSKNGPAVAIHWAGEQLISFSGVDQIGVFPAPEGRAWISYDWVRGTGLVGPPDTDFGAAGGIAYVECFDFECALESTSIMHSDLGQPRNFSIGETGGRHFAVVVNSGLIDTLEGNHSGRLLLIAGPETN